MTDQPDGKAHGPLILGSGGRIGRAFRSLHSAGHWPSPAAPLWHARHGADYVWDMLQGPAPRDSRLSGVSGMIVLAGGRSGGDISADEAASLARAAMELAAREGIGPILICSSQAVYGPGPGPHPEDGPLAPHTDYGRSKQATEAAVGGRATCLRIGNVAGCDMLLRNAASGRVTLDRFADGHGPRRCYIGPLTLARVMLGLIGKGPALPPVVNVAAPGTVAMETLLVAAGLAFDWRPAPADALPALALDLSRLRSLLPLDPECGTPRNLIAEARLAGWEPAP